MMKTFLNLWKNPLDYSREDEMEIKKFSRIEYATPSVGFLEGYYSPAKYELIGSGTKRGRILKKQKEFSDGYIYYFGNDSRIRLIERLSDGSVADLAYYCHEDYVSYGFWYYVIENEKILTSITREVRDTSGNTVEYDVIRALYDNEMQLEYLRAEAQSFNYLDDDIISVVFEQGKYSCRNGEYHCSQQVFDSLGKKETPFISNSNRYKNKALKLLDIVNSTLGNCSNINDVLSIFEKMCTIMNDKDDDLLLYEGIINDDNLSELRFVRQFSAGDGEYYQLLIVAELENNYVNNTVRDSIWQDEMSLDYPVFVKNTDSFKIAELMPFVRVVAKLEHT